MLGFVCYWKKSSSDFLQSFCHFKTIDFSIEVADRYYTNRYWKVLNWPVRSSHPPARAAATRHGTVVRQQPGESSERAAQLRHTPMYILTYRETDRQTYSTVHFVTVASCRDNASHSLTPRQRAVWSPPPLALSLTTPSATNRRRTSLSHRGLSFNVI